MATNGRSSLGSIRRGLRLSPELKVGLGGTIVLALIATAGRIVVPIAIQQIIDGGITDQGVDMGFVGQRVAWAALAVVITAATSGWMNYRLARVAETALSGIRIKAFRHIHDLSMLHQASEQRGALVSRVTSDVDEISRFMQWAGLMLLTNIGQALVSLIAMLVYSVQLALVPLLALPLIVLSVRWFQRRLEVAYGIVREKVGNLLGTLAESVVGAPVIRAYGAEAAMRLRLGKVIEEHRASGVEAGSLSSRLSGVAELFSGLVLAGVLVVGTVLAVNGVTTVGTVVAFIFLVQLFVEPVRVLGEAVNEAQNAVAGWRRVLDILDIAPDVADPGDEGVRLPGDSLDARFVSVAFRYPLAGETGLGATGHLALHDVDVHIAARSKVAVVGETGSGKTTFAKLLTRLMDPTEGVVLIGGIDARKIRFDSLRDRVVMVPQEGMLFRGSIGDNVLMGRPEANRDELFEAFTTLGLDDWLAEMGEGMDTPVGERGSALSVGERQLVTLARAAVANPDLLVLDEATSSVDPATEVRISRALAGLTAGRTVITIAHRLSTAEAADRVLVFDGGRLVEDGTHRELVVANGIYTRLYQAWEREK
ncbi:MAG: ATP-binding cassette domain-containing protein [Acidimicrobiia bacterium]|nr:ATP-binding cassette domain-containing protein [Acidimicrobiia bacterium]